MLSILIPVFNFDVVPLVNNLVYQIDTMESTAEILVFDDGSSQEFKKLNRALESISLVKYMELPSNLGRSAIRNKLAEEARYEYLLFLDCDVMPESDVFLKAYLDNLTRASLLCGGLSYSPEAPEDESLFLHWFYGRNREVRSAAERQKAPYRMFLSSNFLIKKSVFQSVKFDEDFTGYGHEDTVFGIECLKQQVGIFHLENPVIHLGLDPFEIFMEKRIHAVRGLDKLKARIKEKRILEKHIRILAMEKRIKKIRLEGIVRRILSMAEPFFLRNLQGPSPNLNYFDLLRLKYLLRFGLG